MIGVNRRGVRLAAVGTILVGLVGCSSVEGGGEAAPGQPVTVRVEKRDLTSTVVLTGTVLAQPLFALAAPESGPVQFRSALRVDGVAAAGTALAHVGESDIVLAADATIRAVHVVEGSSVAKNIPVADVQYAGFGVRVQVPAEQLFRIYEAPTRAKASIVGSGAGMDCELVPEAAVPGPPVDGAEADGEPAVLCLLGVDALAAAGLSAQVGLRTGNATGALVLPIAAVSGSSDRGVVTLMREGRPTRTEVALGISDGAYIQITEGLSEGDEVVAAAPDLGMQSE